MSAPGKSNTVQLLEEISAGRRAGSSPRRLAHGPPIPGLVYDLRDPGGSSDAFYSELAMFCDLLVAEIDGRAGTVTDAFGKYVQAECNESPRSPAEYSIDLLTLGLMLRRYSRAAEDSPTWAIKLARCLFRLRSKQVWIKPGADLLRAAIIRLFLMPRMGRGPYEGTWPPERPPRLIAWLQATGEFEQEVLCIDHWHNFLGTLPRAEAEHWIATAADLFDWFEQEAEWTLGAYTKGVPRFLTSEYARRGCREDQIFCGKPAVEYHMGMVATEVMNRGMPSGVRSHAAARGSGSGVHARSASRALPGGSIGRGHALHRLRSGLHRESHHPAHAQRRIAGLPGSPLHRVFQVA
jgi:hypothetical protein